MVFEHINVRMTRSNGSINWGFQLRQLGADVSIGAVEKDSMADKAGVQSGDAVEQVMGVKPSNLADAQRRIQGSNEVALVLKRIVTTPPSLPWTLEEKGNQVVVNHFDGRGRLTGVSDQNTSGYQNSFQSSQVLQGQPASQEIHRSTNYKRTETREGNVLASNEPLPLPYSNTINSESHSNWDDNEGNIKKHFESNRTYTRTESSNIAPGAGSGSTSGMAVSSGAAPFSQNGFNTQQRSGTAAPFTSSQTQHSYSTATGATPGSNKVAWQSSGNTNWSQQNQNTNWSQGQKHASENWNQGQQRGGGYGNENSAQWVRQGQQQPMGHGSAGGGGQKHVVLQDNGPRHSPMPGSRSAGGTRNQSVTPSAHDHYGDRAYYTRSPRTARELSPHATIAHLQYNSPLAMYSPEAAAEAYKMQTGQDMTIDGDYPAGGRPAYMDSATRRLIAEQEQGMRYRSPTPQSSSFKRISSACGTPVN